MCTLGVYTPVYVSLCVPGVVYTLYMPPYHTRFTVGHTLGPGPIRGEKGGTLCPF